MANQIRIILTLDGKQYEAALNKATGQTQGFEAAAKRTGTAATVMAGALRASGIAFSVLGAVQVVRTISQAGIAFERVQIALRSVSNDSAQAAERFAFVLKEADRLGLEIESTAQGYVKLAAATRGTTLEGQETERIFSAVSHAAAKLSLSVSDTEGVLRALSQIASKGTLSAEELRQQLGDRLPGAFQLAAQAMGVTTAQLNEMLARGEIASEEFLPRFAAAIEKAMGLEQTERVNTTTAAFTRFMNEMKLTGNAIATYLNPALATAADHLSDMLLVARENPWMIPLMLSPPGQVGAHFMADRIRREQAPPPPTTVPFTNPVTSVTGAIDQYASGLTTLPPQYGRQVEFYGQLDPGALNEEAEKRIVLLREEIALIGMKSETEKAYYQITEGRYRNEHRQVKDLIVELARKNDQEKANLEAEKEAKRLEEERVQTLERLRQAYDPISVQARQWTLDLEALNVAYARGAINFEEYLRLYQGLNEAQDKLIEKTNELPDRMAVVAEQAARSIQTITSSLINAALAGDNMGRAVTNALRQIAAELAAQALLQSLGAALQNSGNATLASIGTILSGKREYGGPVKAGGMYEVGERGKPELLESGGRYYLIPGQGGQVTPATSRSGGGGGKFRDINVNYNIDAHNNDPASMAHLIRVMDEKAAAVRQDLQEAITRGEFD